MMGQFFERSMQARKHLASIQARKKLAGKILSGKQAGRKHRHVSTYRYEMKEKSKQACT